MRAADRGALERDTRAALQKLTSRVPAAKSLSRSAAAVLVFPKMTKAGIGIGGQCRDGVLLKGGNVAGYYNTSGASHGLQAGAQTSGYELSLMNDKAVGALGANDGFEAVASPIWSPRSGRWKCRIPMRPGAEVPVPGHWEVAVASRAWTTRVMADPHTA